jgi:hypothetical protein
LWKHSDCWTCKLEHNSKSKRGVRHSQDTGLLLNNINSHWIYCTEYYKYSSCRSRFHNMSPNDPFPGLLRSVIEHVAWQCRQTATNGGMIDMIGMMHRFELGPKRTADATTPMKIHYKCSKCNLSLPWNAYFLFNSYQKTPIADLTGPHHDGKKGSNTIQKLSVQLYKTSMSYTS